MKIILRLITIVCFEVCFFINADDNTTVPTTIRINVSNPVPDKVIEVGINGIETVRLWMMGVSHAPVRANTSKDTC
jgi:hypothetical protein